MQFWGNFGQIMGYHPCLDSPLIWDRISMHFYDKKAFFRLYRLHMSYFTSMVKFISKRQWEKTMGLCLIPSILLYRVGWHGLLLIRAVDPGFPNGVPTRKVGSQAFYFGHFFPKNCMKLKKEGPRGRGCVSLVALDPPLYYQFTKHLLVTACDNVWTRVICCPGSVHACPTALSVPQMENLKNTKSQSCTDQCYHIVDSFRGAVIIHVQLRPLCFKVVFRGINWQCLFFRECLKINKYKSNYFSNLLHSYNTIRK